MYIANPKHRISFLVLKFTVPVFCISSKLSKKAWKALKKRVFMQFLEETWFRIYGREHFERILVLYYEDFGRLLPFVRNSYRCAFTYDFQRSNSCRWKSSAHFDHLIFLPRNSEWVPWKEVENTVKWNITTEGGVTMAKKEKYESMRIISVEGSMLYKNEGFTATKNGNQG